MNLRSRFLLALSLLIVSCFTSSALAAPSIDPLLVSEIQKNPLGATAVIITYDHQPTSSDLNALKLIGISGGIVLQKLPMVLTAINAAQFESLKQQSGILSLYANRIEELHTNTSRSFIGVTSLRTDAELTRGNGGLPISGKGIGVAVVDTGIDATHPDLQFGRTVRQNVQIPLAEVAVAPTACPAAVGGPGVSFNLGLAGPVYVENVPQTDLEGGHGTFVSGIIAGNGQQSGGFYGGVAPGAHLIGIVAGNDCGLPQFGILQAFDYILVKQVEYNIRVVNNSWGSRLRNVPWDPNHPINVATRRLHDHFITVVFSAGNGISSVGDVPGAISPYSTAPWVISVAASQKQGFGVPTIFSSRGENNGTGTDVAGQPADPNAPPNLRPDITAPGLDIKSTRNKSAGLTNLAASVPLLGNDLLTIAPAFLPYYTTSQGTSFSAPHVSGVVALMLEANPQLSPDDVVTILRATATPMPYDERVVGAGYLDAHNAVRMAAGLAAVSHPANLVPAPGTPEIQDPANDQWGIGAQDIIQGSITYDAAANQLVYRLDLADLSTRANQMRWTVSSVFGGVTVFVAAAINEQQQATFNYGKTAPDPNTGVNTQTNLGAPVFAEISGNTIVWKLNVPAVSAAVGFDVIGTRSTSVEAVSWWRAGSTLTPSLLLRGDDALGSDFRVEDPTPPPPPPPPPAAYCERFSGVLPVGEALTSALAVKLPFLDAKLNYHPGSSSVLFELNDSEGNLVPDGSSQAKRITAGGLTTGDYAYHLLSGASEPLDYAINSCQAPNAEE